jgi:hypothetical protein
MSPIDYFMAIFAGMCIGAAILAHVLVASRGGLRLARRLLIAPQRAASGLSKSVPWQDRRYGHRRSRGMKGSA